MSGIFGGGGGGDDGGGDDAAIEASKIQAEYQQKALDYLMQSNKLPQEVRDSALGKLQSFYGGGQGQQAFIDQAKQNPFYQAQMGGIPAGEEAILRNQAATGGLRGGDANAALHQYNVQTQGNALTGALNQQIGGLQSLAGMPTNNNAIAGMQAGIGQTLGQGMIGSANNQNAGNQAGFGNLMGLASLGMQGASIFSDERLKSNIKLISKTGHSQINFYSWDWNEDAKLIGMSGSSAGYIAQEVELVWPDLVSEHEGGYKQVLFDEIERRLN